MPFLSTGIQTGRMTRYSYEKKIHDQHITLVHEPVHQDGKPTKTTFAPGLHKFPFEFVIPNSVTETIEDETGKVFYTLTAALHRASGLTNKIKARRNVLVLRTPSDMDLTNNGFASASIVTERHTEACDAVLMLEKTTASSGTAFPIDVNLHARTKHVYLESMSALLSERRIYRLPEFNTQRGDMFSYRLPLHTITNQASPEADADLDRSVRRAVFTKNAHVPLTGEPFHYRFEFHLPNCLDLSHSSTFPEIDIQHFFKLTLTFSTPGGPMQMHLETNVTVLDCRLKQDYTILPTYEAALATTSTEYDAGECEDPSHFFVCPCYLAYKKNRMLTKKEWVRMRHHSRLAGQPFDDYGSPCTSASASPLPSPSTSTGLTVPPSPPPSYDAIVI
ncbi:hypothetical protein DM01DRAFT_1339179 [Hesseltinella vesiculosa]|uniref:Arrestin-like N-terminal domain-containing protein n=1 Tax=Hesseltinella vesiculosa TaxID=101127 RepID=A0A1X2G7L8_9FUNG|nr:hypothetical protein DM01DRAFT_1339179 [Hesseltinella vesiculosa]